MTERVTKLKLSFLHSLTASSCSNLVAGTLVYLIHKFSTNFIETEQAYIIDKTQTLPAHGGGVLQQMRGAACARESVCPGR